MEKVTSVLLTIMLIFVVAASGCTGTVLLKNANEGDNASTSDGMHYVLGNTSMLAKCSKTQLLIQKASYSDGKLNITLANTGEVAIQGFIINITYSDGSVMSKEMTSEISPGVFSELLIEANTNIESVLVQSKECAGAQDRLGKYDIAGL